MKNELEIIKNALPENGENWIVKYDEEDDDDVMIIHEKYYTNNEKQKMETEIQKALAFAGFSTFFFFERATTEEVDPIKKECDEKYPIQTENETEETKTETYEIQYTQFTQIIELTIEDETVSYRYYNQNNGEWVESISQINSNWSFQDPKTEEAYNNFLKEVSEFTNEIEEPTPMSDWVEDMEIGEKIMNNYGHSVERRA